VTPPLSREALGAIYSLPPLTGEGNRRCGGGVAFSTCLTIILLYTKKSPETFPVLLL